MKGSAGSGFWCRRAVHPLHRSVLWPTTPVAVAASETISTEVLCLLVGVVTV